MILIVKALWRRSSIDEAEGAGSFLGFSPKAPFSQPRRPFASDLKGGCPAFSQFLRLIGAPITTCPWLNANRRNRAQLPQVNCGPCMLIVRISVVSTLGDLCTLAEPRDIRILR